MRLTMKSKLTPFFLFVLLVVILIGTTTAHAQRTENQRWEDLRYEDMSTFKNGATYIVDPYVWAYTREFADLFRMPEKWIDGNLKGVLAVAFRMSTTGNFSCGYGGREDNCWPPLNCQMDVYYDNHIKLPWVREDIVRDFLMPGISSYDHLVPVDPKVIRRYVPRDSDAPRGVMEAWSVDWTIPPRTSGAFWNILYYDREYQPNIGLIGFQGLCPSTPSNAYIRFYSLESARKAARGLARLDPRQAIHTIELPESFMRRANAAYQAQNKPNNEVTQRLLKQFFESRQPAVKP